MPQKSTAEGFEISYPPVTEEDHEYRSMTPSVEHSAAREIHPWLERLDKEGHLRIDAVYAIYDREFWYEWDSESRGSRDLFHLLVHNMSGPTTPMLAPYLLIEAFVAATILHSRLKLRALAKSTTDEDTDLSVFAIATAGLLVQVLEIKPRAPQEKDHLKELVRYQAVKLANYDLQYRKNRDYLRDNLTAIHARGIEQANEQRRELETIMKRLRNGGVAAAREHDKHSIRIRNNYVTFEWTKTASALGSSTTVEPSVSEPNRPAGEYSSQSNESATTSNPATWIIQYVEGQKPGGEQRDVLDDMADAASMANAEPAS